MRRTWWTLCFVAWAGCGFQVNGGTSVDSDGGIDSATDGAPDGSLPEVPARLLPGGGISDAPIGGVVHVFVVNALTRQPIANARVDVGATTGTTDASGRFDARGAALQGKQTVVAAKAGFRTEVWVGVQGANVTILLRPSPMPAVPQATIAGTIPAIAGPTMMSHYKLGLVSYSDHDDQLDVENQIATPNNTDYCVAPACAYTVATRTGTVSLLGGLYDVDTKGTGTTNDDTASFLGWAIETGITVVDGVPQIGHVLPAVMPAQLQTVTVDLSGAPAGYTPFGAVGIEVSEHEVLNLQTSARVGAPSIKAPALTVVPNSRYRLTAVLVDGQGARGIVYRRRLTTAALATGAWFVPPPPATADHTGASWTPPPDATISGVVFRDGTTDLVAIVAFDGSVASALPAGVTLPTSAQLTVQPTALRATFDVKSFAFDSDRVKIDGVAAGRAAAVN